VTHRADLIPPFDAAAAGAAPNPSSSAFVETRRFPISDRRILVTGAGGQLGGYLLPALRAAGAIPVGLGRRMGPGIDIVADLTDADSVARAFAAAAPDAVIHAAAWTDVDDAERDEEGARRVNEEGSRHIARAASAAGIRLIAVSTDFVFPGDGGAPYAEDAAPDPVSAYGRTKLLGERAVLAADPGFAVARTAWVYGGPGKHFPRTVLSVLRARGGMSVVDDEFGSPTFAGDLAEALVALLASGGSGVYHLANEGRTSRYHLARAVVAAAGFDPGAIHPVSTAEFLASYPLPARRPPDSTLANHRAAVVGIRLRPWQDAVAAYAPRLAAEFTSSQ
jgi:dTDP-4-dehydrorhamnose reductase